ncbi:hypothetical protein KAW18_12760 [candidate division WOR-3 bacterium]|nr:hypothetical protein [candidate division WOR-3 bacterium]
MNKKEYIKELENIKNKNSITIDNLEMLLSEMKKGQEQLLQILMSLKSKVKNDEVER